MATKSKIEWLHYCRTEGHTLNLWHGCSKDHTGCLNCYAEKQANRYNPGLFGVNANRKRITHAFTNLAKQQRAAKKTRINSACFLRFNDGLG